MNLLRKPLLWSASLLIFFAFSLTLIIRIPAEASSAFITTWKTDIKGSSAYNQITIPTNSAATYDYFIDWGDGNTDSGVTGNITHTYAQPGTYTVKISGLFPRIHFANEGDRRKILSVENWGNISWQSFESAFFGATNLVINATDRPNLSSVTNMSNAFRNAKKITTGFENWNVGSVEVFGRMFSGASLFNSDISGWNTSSARNTEYMFFQAVNFNQNLNNWNMSNVGILSGMFSGASSFNQPISAWDLTIAHDIELLFKNAASFDQSLGSLDIGKFKQIDELLGGVSLSTAEYDATLIAWSQNQTARNVILDAGNSSYCNGADARNYLVTQLNWVITDGGADTVFCGSVSVAFETLPFLEESQPAETLVGNLIIDSTVPGNFSLSLGCSPTNYDNQFFELRGNQLFTTTAFDYEKPIDENTDGTHEICLVVSNGNGESVKKFVIVSIQDVDDETTGQNANQGTGGQTLGSNTGDPQVLASKDSAANKDSSGKVLAATGVAVGLIGVYIGLAIAGVTVVGFRKTKGYTAKDIEI